jgi:hypothetical protein
MERRRSLPGLVSPFSLTVLVSSFSLILAIAKCVRVLRPSPFGVISSPASANSLPSAPDYARPHLPSAFPGRRPPTVGRRLMTAEPWLASRQTSAHFYFARTDPDASWLAGPRNPQRPLDVDSSRPLRADSGHVWTAPLGQGLPWSCCERLGRGHVYGLLMRKGWLRWP